MQVSGRRLAYTAMGGAAILANGQWEAGPLEVCVPQRSSIALLLVIAGVVLIVVGLLAWVGALSWFGRLPGDIRVERPGMRLYAPITWMVLISVALTVIAAIVRRLWP